MVQIDRQQRNRWVREGKKILGAKGEQLAVASHATHARRIVAALNAVERIPTAMLEDGIVWKLVQKHNENLLRQNPGLEELLSD